LIYFLLSRWCFLWCWSKEELPLKLSPIPRTNLDQMLLALLLIFELYSSS
ncbi:unnamed protein product, partial [Prunus brigantina]